MNGSEALSAVAQLALGLAGFTGIVVVFGRQPGRLRPVEVYRLANLLAISCEAMFLALLPFGLYYAGLQEESLWRFSSGFMIGLTVVLLAGFSPSTTRFVRETPEIFNLYVLTFLVTAHIANLVVQFLNVLGVFGRPNLGVYFFGLLWLLLHGFAQFARILFIRPGPERPLA